MAEDCIFCRIIKGEIPSTKVYEDDKMIAINDVAPAAPVHVLLLPKEHTANITTVLCFLFFSLIFFSYFILI